jgi:hypothetical protein
VGVGAAVRDAQATTLQFCGEVRSMRAQPVEWRGYHINLAAFLHTQVFGMPLPPALAPITRADVARWLNIKPQDMFVDCGFKAYA